MGLFGPPNIEKLKRERNVAKLIKALSHKEWVIREEAADALDSIGWKPMDDSEKTYCLFAKRDWDELVRIEKPSVEPLIQALKDKYSSDVQENAVEALGKIGDARAVKPLIQVLRKDKDSDMRRKAAWALGEIGDARVIKPLIQALKKDKDWYVPQWAAWALEKIGKPAVEPLIQALKDKDEIVRENAAEALEEITEEFFGEDYEAWSKWWQKHKK